MQRLYDNWVYGGFLMGLILLALLPLFVAGWPLLLQLGALSLPVYAIHQYEEHDADRFRLFVNDVIGGGKTALSKADVFWINTIGVWLYLVAVIYVGKIYGLGWIMAAPFLLGVNGLAHVLQAIFLRRYNPGLISAAILFLPLTGWMLWLGYSATNGLQMMCGLALAILAHLLILLLIWRNLLYSAKGN